MTTVAALVLAAGRGSRFGAAADESKTTALLDGVPLVRHVVATALASIARPVFVVTGHAGSTVVSALLGRDIVLVENPDHGAGLSTSLKAGIAALPREIDGVLVLLADMPLVRVATLDRLIAAFAEVKPEAVVPVCTGRRGNPILLSRTLFAMLATLSGDHGARALLDGRDVRCCDVDDPGIFADIDTPEMLHALSKG